MQSRYLGRGSGRMETVIFSPASRYLKWPLGRVLVVAFTVSYILFLKLLDKDGYVQEAYIAFHFGMATGLASWAVLSTGPNWLRRLGIALLLTVSSGTVYPHHHSDWLPVAAVIGVYSGIIFAAMAGLLLMLKWWKRRRSKENGERLQFGVKHLLWATLAMVPLALVIRVAMPQFSETDVIAVLSLGIDTIGLGLVIRWLLGQNRRAGMGLWGRVAISGLIATVMAYTLTVSQLANWGPFNWYTYQFVLWLLLTAGHLLPRFDRYVVAIAFFAKEECPVGPRENSLTGPRKNSPDGPREKSPDGAYHVSPGQRPGVEGMSLYNEP